MSQQQSCAERIGQHAKSRLEDFAALTTLAGHHGENTPEIIRLADSQDLEADADYTRPDEIAEQAQERIYEYPLSAEIKRVLRIDLSTGGPADWLEVLLDSDGEPERITYHFADWFDHAEQQLDGEDFAAAAAFARNFIVE